MRFYCAIVLIEKSEGKSSLGIPRNRMEDNIKIYFRKIRRKVEVDSFGSR
jgi:hypothetical protein